MRKRTFVFAVLLALLVVLSFTATALAADGRVVQNDPNNPIKFSIDASIATGSVSTQNLYIGTLASYLGARADGKTSAFQGGFGKNPNDILIMNDRVGIVLAAGTADPWGYPGGSILDAGRITSLPAGATDLKGATFGEDTVLTVQFLFNAWDAWAPSNAGIVYFDLVNYNFATKSIDNVNGVPAVKVNRKFTVPYNLAGVSTARDLDVVSYYSIAPGKDYAYMFDTVTNNGVAFAASTNNELSLSNKGGDGIDTKTVAALTAANTYNWVADAAGNPVRQFSTTMISPGVNMGSDGRTHPYASFTGATGYRELRFADLPYAVGESRLYESYLMIDDQCSWQKVFDFWADYKGLDTFHVAGAVTDAAGDPVPYPVVIINRGATLYGWVMGDKAGNYAVDLPNENATQEYNLRVEKSGTARGVASANFTSASASLSALDLKTGPSLVPVTFRFRDQAGNPVWGRLSVGSTPTIPFTGKAYFFSDNTADGSVDKGVVTALIAPGAYSATCYGEGFGFYSYTTNTSAFSQVIAADTATPTQTVTINKTLSAPTDWFGIDNHHHGVRSDAFSPPEVVSKAQMTAGLEVLTLDDHEYVLDNAPMYDWSKKMNATGYMPSEEVTASWAHFDIMPLTISAYTRFLDRGQTNPIVNTNASLQGIIDDAHNAGASIGAMHPNSSYGLFLADDNKTVPGGMTDDFDGIEAQLSNTTLNEAISFWNAYLVGGTHRGVTVTKPHYIYASTDIHDSGNGTSSGARRSYVYVEDGAAKSQADFDAFSLEFAKSQAAGHSYNSSGVFVTPTSGKMFGNTYWTDASGAFTATFKVSALNNITDIYVFGSTGTGAGTGTFTCKNLVSRTTYTGSDLRPSKNFTLAASSTASKQWYAIAAVASGGRAAFTNPIWVNVDTAGPSSSIDGAPASWVDHSVPLSFSADDASGVGVDFIEYKIGDGAWIKGGAVSVTAEGTTVVACRATDKLGNVGPEATASVFIDTTGPGSFIDGVPATWVTHTVPLSFTGDDGNGSGVDFIEYKIGDGAWIKGGAVSVTAEGTTVVACRATDKLGNVGPVTSASISIDTSTPKLTLRLSGLTRGVMRHGRRVTARCTVTPRRLLYSKVTLTVERRRGARWVKVQSATVTMHSTAVYGWKYTPDKAGTYRMRARLAETAANAAAKTAWHKFTVK